MGRLRGLIVVTVAVVVALAGYVSFQPSKSVIAVTQEITQASLLDAASLTVDRAPISEYVDTMTVAQPGTPVALTVDLTVEHAAIADLLILLEHVPTGTLTRLVNHTGAASGVACTATQLDVTLHAKADTSLDAAPCTADVIQGDFAPFTVAGDVAFVDFLAITDMAGDWRLIVHDYGESGAVPTVEWALNIEFAPSLVVAQTEDPNPDPDPVDPVDPSEPETPASSVPVFISSLGLVQMSTSNVQQALQSPAGEPVRINGAELFLPNDADGNGFDTFVVTGLAAVDGEVWVALFLGGPNSVWVPLDGVTPLAFLGEDAVLDEAVDSNSRVFVPPNVRHGLAE